MGVDVKDKDKLRVKINNAFSNLPNTLGTVYTDGCMDYMVEQLNKGETPILDSFDIDPCIEPSTLLGFVKSSRVVENDGIKTIEIDDINIVKRIPIDLSDYVVSSSFFNGEFCSISVINKDDIK